MELHYCAICGMRITDAELKDGSAVITAEKRALCKKCYSDVAVSKTPAAKTAPVKPAGKAPSSASKPSHVVLAGQMARRQGSSAPIWIGIGVAVLALGIAFGMNRRDDRVANAPKPSEKPPAETAKPDVPAKPETPKPEPVKSVPVPTPVMPAAQSTFKAVPIGSRGNKRGYWEFLPSAYQKNPAQTFPIVIFFCGVPESGDGSAAQLQKVLKAGPPNILSDSTHPLHNLFEQRGVIVISAQGPAEPDWWHSPHILPFLADVLRDYRIDRKRIYLTGLVAGALGLHEVLDRDVEISNQIAAVWMACSQGGVGLLGGAKSGPETVAKIPYWAFVNGADSNETVRGVNAVAGKISGKEPTDVLASAPSGGKIRTALFTPFSGWKWLSGIPTPGSATPILTLVEGTPQETWTTAYNKAECWDWLLAQQKK
jgi:hypothetical protein